jgi:hypothetical protein
VYLKHFGNVSKPLPHTPNTLQRIIIIITEEEEVVVVEEEEEEEEEVVVEEEGQGRFSGPAFAHTTPHPRRAFRVLGCHIVASPNYCACLNRCERLLPHNCLQPVFLFPLLLSGTTV